MNIYKKSGFTLAEVLSVLVILGIVATLTIPSAIRRHREQSDRIRITKAASTFDKFVNMYLLENGIKSENEAATIFTNNGCDSVLQYFKVREVISNGRRRCVFETNDDLRWDFRVFTYDDQLNVRGLGANVSFRDQRNIRIDGREIELPSGDKINSFHFYFHFDPESGGLFVNDSNHVPWYHYQGVNWCGQNPFGHGCWTGMLEYDAKAMTVWQYLHMVEYHEYDINF